MRISDWSSDVCSSDLAQAVAERLCHRQRADHRFLAPVRPEKQPPDEQTGRTNKQTETAVERAGERERRTRRHRSEEHTSELQSLMRISYAVFCLKKKKKKHKQKHKELHNQTIVKY